MHPMGATMPQECVAVFTMCFMSEQLQVQFNVPSYQAWLDEQDMHATYEFHKRFLQHAQSLAFAAVHQQWIGGFAAGVLYAYAQKRRGLLSDAIVAHAVTNALIAMQVLFAGHWSLW